MKAKVTYVLVIEIEGERTVDLFAAADTKLDELRKKEPEIKIQTIEVVDAQ